MKCYVDVSSGSLEFVQSENLVITICLPLKQVLAFLPIIILRFSLKTNKLQQCYFPIMSSSVHRFVKAQATSQVLYRPAYQYGIPLTFLLLLNTESGTIEGYQS